MTAEPNSQGLQAALRRLMKHTRPESDGIPRVDRSEPLPLSFAQQRLWLVDRLSPGSAAYNVPLAVRVRGGLDVGVLGEALSVVVGRHEVLRTVFR
ncbi:condensation domain-containing protein, partial [Streptomyces sp. NPDC053750]|uniref:condensation domain-containing protein n=1 Tax=Streptomyces sp. NPDC053750 TaxID=3365714 RepID=UPI0037D6B155